MKHEDSTLDFPVHKVSISKKKKTSSKKSVIRFNSRSVTAASIFTVLVMAFWLNQEIFEKNVVSDGPAQGRGLASLGDPVAQTESVWKKNLVKRLAMKTNSGVSARGKKPSKLDKLAFGLLAGEYNMNSINGKVRLIELRADAKGYKVESPSRFIEHFSGLLPVMFSKAKKVSQLDSNQVVFSLVDAGGAQKGTLTLKMNEENHLQTLNFEPAHSMVESL